MKWKSMIIFCLLFLSANGFYFLFIIIIRRCSANTANNNFRSTGTSNNPVLRATPANATVTPHLCFFQPYNYTNWWYQSQRSGQSSCSNSFSPRWMSGRWPSSMLRRLRNLYMVNLLEIHFLFFFLLLFLFAKKNKTIDYFFILFFLVLSLWLGHFFALLHLYTCAADATIQTKITLSSSDQICDGIKNCPGGEDEDPNKCPGTNL